MIGSVTHLVVTDNFAGVERYVTTVASETHARGWDVRVIGGRREEMKDLLPAAVPWTPASTLGSAGAALWRDPSDVVHAHMTKAEVTATLLPGRRRIVATRHFAARRGRNQLVMRATDLLARRIDAEIAISQTVRDASGSRHMGVLLNPVPTVSRCRRPERTVVVAQRWDTEKRTTDAVLAFDLSGLAERGWHLILHGEGSDEAVLRRSVAASRCAAAIDVAGYSRDMPDVLARAGIVLATADHEPFGLVVAEAMAAAVPVIASAAGGHLETVGQVTNSFLYPPGRVTECARLLTVLAGTELAERERYGAELQSWAVRHLSVRDHVDRLLDLYDRSPVTP